MPTNESVPLEQRHPSIPWVTRRFQFHIDALRELLNEMLPQFSELDEQHFGPDALTAMKSLPPDKRQQLQGYIDERIAEARAGDPPSTEGSDSPNSENGAQQDSASEPTEQTEEVQIQFSLQRITEVFGGDRHYTGVVLKEVEHLAAGPRRMTILHNSLLAMAIGAFEVLVAGVATQFFIQHRGSLEGDEKVFSLTEIREFEDLDDAADAVIALRIASMMQDGLEGWATWFEENCDAAFADLAIDFEQVGEAFQRRHVVLHNGGLVSRQYLNKVPSAAGSVEVGERLPVGPEYLNDVFDELDTLGTALGLLAEGTWQKEHRDYTASLILRRSYELMVQGRWRAAQALAALEERLACKSVIKTSLRCNDWLCRSELYGPESIKDEVADFDTSDLAPRFEIVRKILLGQTDEALQALPELIKSNEITRGELSEWPILRKLREHPEFDRVVADLNGDPENG